MKKEIANYCKDCSFYSNRRCFFNPTKSFTLWGDEKACDKFKKDKNEKNINSDANDD
jgi:hypothetical protein